MTINTICTFALLGLTATAGLYSTTALTTGGASSSGSIAAVARPVTAMPEGEFRSEEGRFSITLPAGFSEPSESVSPMPTAGGDVDLKMYSATALSGNSAAMFAFANMEGKLEMEGHETAMLDGARDNVLKAMNGTLIKEKQITIDGHPGRSLVLSMKQPGVPKLYSRIDMYMVDPIMYQVMYVSDKKASLDSKAITSYFKSFRLE
jgi:hypothetical protein